MIATRRVDYGGGKLLGGEWLNGFAVVGVNSFILISGYFRIQFKWKKLFFIFYSIAFVCGVDYLLHISGSSLFNFDYAWHTIVPFHAKANWFIPAYIGLMLLSPLLNGGLEHLGAKKWSRLILLLTLLNFYAYFTNISSLNPNGYSLVHFIYLYVLGAWMKVLPSFRPLLCILFYVFAALFTGLVAVKIHSGFTAYAYNSPQVLLSSAALFLFFKEIHLKKSWINRLAASTFTVFLFHYIILYHVKALGHFQDLPLLQLGLIYLLVFFASYLLHELIAYTYHFFDFWKK